MSKIKGERKTKKDYKRGWFVAYILGLIVGYILGIICGIGIIW